MKEAALLHDDDKLFKNIINSETLLKLNIKLLQYLTDMSFILPPFLSMHYSQIIYAIH